jgi:hypothetical protein
LTYISVATTSATIKSPFTIVPTPKTLRIKKKVTASERRNPLLELSKRSERNKKRARKKKRKKTILGATRSGLVEKTTIATTIHKAKSKNKAG